MLVQQIPEEKVRTMGMSITFDVGYVAQILNTQDIILRGVASAGSNAHGVNETIKLKDIKKFVKEILIFLCEDLQNQELQRFSAIRYNKSIAIVVAAIALI